MSFKWSFYYQDIFEIILSLFNLSHDDNPNWVTHTHAEKILVCECV